MDWLASINTLIGAGIGVGSTLLADRFRWHRERVRISEEARRQIFRHSWAPSRIPIRRYQKEFRQLLDEYIAAAEEAQVAMRKDLGTSWKRDQRV